MADRIRFSTALSRQAAWLCVLGFAVGGSLLAQEIALPAKDGAPATLHVYTNLIQIPVLVLAANRDRLEAPVAPSLFSVSLDSGPWFRATHVRPEGDDAISLSILLDVNGAGSELMPKIDETIASLAPLSLHAKDHVSIYVLDCTLTRSANDVPANATLLRSGVEVALKPWQDRKQARQGCQNEKHVSLKESLAYMVGELRSLPGRRVILAMSDGADTRSKMLWTDLTSYAQSAGVAIFGVRYYSAARARPAMVTLPSSGREDPFPTLCELSGGLLFETRSLPLDDMLKRFTAMLRERYIVEFPRPPSSTAGRHSIDVRVEKSNDFIRSSGISVPMPDAAVLADPTTVPQDPSNAPVYGKRKVLSQK